MDLFLEKHIENGAKILDDFTFKGGFVDSFDGPLYKLVLNQLNKAISPKIPDGYKPDFHETLDRVFEKDWDDAGAEAIDIVKTVVSEFDIDESIQSIITGLLDVIKGALANKD
jgi:hypothetical protein